MTKDEANKFYLDKRVLITGHSGFKGSWMVKVLNLLGAKVFGISNKSISKNRQWSEPNDLEGEAFADITDFKGIRQAVEEFRPEVVFHLAAKAITLSSYDEPLDTFNTNAMGTANLLESIRVASHDCRVVIVTSDKCYENQNWAWGYRETDGLGGKDPYSASKSLAEIIASSYQRSYFSEEGKIRLCTCRAGNVIGGGDWNDLRIIPDCFKAWYEQKAIVLRNPHSVRPWNHVFDVLWGYLSSAFYLDQPSVNGEAFNFGPELNVQMEVESLVQSLWTYSGFSGFNPYKIEQVESGREHRYLRLSSEKARSTLNWQSTLTINEAIKLTAHWYVIFHNEPDEINAFSNQSLNEYLLSK